MTDRNDTFQLDGAYVSAEAKQAVHDLSRPLDDALQCAERATRPKLQSRPRHGPE